MNNIMLQGLGKKRSDVKAVMPRILITVSVIMLLFFIFDYYIKKEDKTKKRKKKKK